ncbi:MULTISPECIES: hypothetical protein [Pandoraea]|uniref:Uncharacterized protein n=3 Tax=Pandoraea TaxID=93217 RepID=A0A5E4W306_9BURK|nr:MULTISPECIES: hypothetical protein [Pandoraea]UVA81480.1 hypothetical protein NTU39_10945 [Pandoraea commovens]SNU85823.1 Uncharacterised protein [Pandoraea sputorum]VVD99185.1 hypothetical protein PSP20601_02039 [Pandoraea sputorum]VVE18239.1 hypothetical protein PCO31010_03015 [Pandoraea commovens]VVE25428.1 hypothetical protein PAQ31011_03386 [Pandoraea aquatica]
MWQIAGILTVSLNWLNWPGWLDWMDWFDLPDGFGLFDWLV